jgi:Putative mono-oxygenase ydhR
MLWVEREGQNLVYGLRRKAAGQHTRRKRMNILVVNFNLKDISEEEYRGLVEPIAPAFAGLPGLVSKTWLANAETNTYGGVYVWSDRGAMEAYKETEIYKGLQANSHFENVTATDFAIVEGATRVTRGHVEVAA